MFAGHVGAALAIGRVEPRLNAGVLVFAALLLDVLLWSFILAGLESVEIPADFAATHQPRFEFPYSHGLAAGIGWSVLAGFVAFAWKRSSPRARLRLPAWLSLAVFSHWVLDALVHAPQLPILGEGSKMIGLGLWQRMPIALTVESLLLLGGLWLFVAGSGLPRARKAWLAIVAVAILGFTLAGMTIAPPPPSATAMSTTSLATILALCALVGWLARRHG